jgi:hypothetical protein
MAVQRVSIDDADVVDSKRSELHIERKDESFPLEDPDAGKSDEEKLRLVSAQMLPFRHHADT